MCANCHVVTVAVQIKDLQALQAACQRLGWKFVPNQTRHKWYGRWVDDSPIPRHLFASEAEYQSLLAMPKAQRCHFMTMKLNHCDHVVRVPDCEYEIGVFWIGDHYALSLDWFGDIGRLKDQNPLPQAYAVEAAKVQARRQGLLHQEVQCENGDIQLRITL